MSPSTTKTRILIISDTHGAQPSKPKRDEEKSNPNSLSSASPFSAPLPKADLLIHCGDLTYVGGKAEYEAAVQMLSEIEAGVKVVIAGNHDVSLDGAFVLGHIDEGKAGFRWSRNREEASLKVQEAREFCLEPDGRARSEGITFLEEGVHHIELRNGAKVKIYASPYTPEFQDFGFAYRRDEDRFNPPEFSSQDATNIAKSPVPSFSTTDPVDFMIVHGPPYGRLDKTSRGEHVGCPHLLNAVSRCRPLVCCFGHIHEAWGAERVRWSKSSDQDGAQIMSTKSLKESDGSKGFVPNIDSIENISVDLATAKEEHSAYLDLSRSSDNSLKKGQETLLVNASIMDLRYHPVNAPWLIDIDLLMGE